MEFAEDEREENKLMTVPSAVGELVKTVLSEMDGVNPSANH